MPRRINNKKNPKPFQMCCWDIAINEQEVSHHICPNHVVLDRNIKT